MDDLPIYHHEFVCFVYPLVINRGWLFFFPIHEGFDPGKSSVDGSSYSCEEDLWKQALVEWCCLSTESFG